MPNHSLEFTHMDLITDPLHHWCSLEQGYPLLGVKLSGL